MKKYFFNYMIIICFCFTLSNAQTKNPFVCSMTSSSSGEWKPAKTPNDSYFRVLIAFAQFASDTEENSSWPLDSLPNWANDFIDDTVKANYTNQTISDYFAMASMDSLNFIGDVYQDTIIIQQDLSYQAANQLVLEELNDNILDFSRYDNWKYENGEFVFSADSADGIIDMIIIIYRNTTHTNFSLAGAVATLNLSNSFLTNDGYEIKSGFFGSTELGGITSKTGLAGKFKNITIIAHEYGHYLFGSGHLNFGGLMPGEPHPGAGDSGTFMMNAWEREWLGYINYTVPTSDGEQITIGDFITTGDAIKIPIPFNDPSSSTFYIIENHQRISDYDQIMRGGELEGQFNFSTTLGSGIYIWKITNGNDWYPTVDIKSADGSWQWSYVDDFEAGSGWYAGSTCCEGLLPMTERSSIDRDNGLSDRHPRHIFWNNHWAQKWVDINPSTKEWDITRNVFGDKYDAFNKDYNELFTPWSNPSSYSSGATNISVELVSQDQYGNITLKVYSTEASAEALPPSKPQGLSVENETEIDFGDNYTATSQLAWFSNDEPDLDYYKVYKATTTGSAPSLNEYAFVCTTDTNTIDLPITDFGDNKKIYYRITAVDTEGKESVKSEGNWDWAPPTPISDLSVSGNDGQSPQLSWAAKSFQGTTAVYDIYKNKDRFFYSYLGQTSNNTYNDETEIIQYGLESPRVRAYYKITARRASRNLQSDYSNIASIWVEGDGWSIKKEGVGEILPDVYAISQNYPNPFNPSTVIKYQLPEAVNVTIKLYDMLGREVKEFINHTQEAGYYELNFDGSDLSSGTYIYRITAGDFVDSKKLILLK